MAHIQDFYSPSELYSPPSQPRLQSRSQFFYDINRSVAVYPELSMAQSSLVSTSGSCRLTGTHPVTAKPPQTKDAHVTVAVVGAVNHHVQKHDLRVEPAMGSALGLRT